TYYHLLTGVPPYPAESSMQVMFAHCSSPVPDPRSASPSVPALAATIIGRAMAKRRGERYGNAAAMLHALEALLATVGPSLHAAPRAPVAEPGPTHHLWPVTPGPRRRLRAHL